VDNPGVIIKRSLHGTGTEFPNMKEIENRMNEKGKGVIATKILGYWTFRVGYWIISFLFLVYQHIKK